MNERAERREQEILAALAVAVRPSQVVATNLCNFKAFNVVVGWQAGDAMLAGVLAGLARLGPTWRTAGDELVTLVQAAPGEAKERVRAFTWLFHTKIAVTDAWRFTFADGREDRLVPWAHHEVVCNPRCGLAEVGADPAAALAAAREACERAAREPEAYARSGFAPLRRPAFATPERLAERGCPICADPRVETLDSDLGWSRERCPACGVAYEREDRQFVLGRDEGGGHA